MIDPKSEQRQYIDNKLKSNVMDTIVSVHPVAGTASDLGFKLHRFMLKPKK